MFNLFPTLNESDLTVGNIFDVKDFLGVRQTSAHPLLGLELLIHFAVGRVVVVPTERAPVVNVLERKKLKNNYYSGLKQHRFHFKSDRRQIAKSSWVQIPTVKAFYVYAIHFG